MALVDDQNYLYFVVDIQEPLHKERVRYLILLSFVVFEARAVVEGHLLDHYFGRDRSLWKFLVSNFDFGGVGVVENWFEAFVLNL